MEYVQQSYVIFPFKKGKEITNDRFFIQSNKSLKAEHYQHLPQKVGRWLGLAGTEQYVA